MSLCVKFHAIPHSYAPHFDEKTCKLMHKFTKKPYNLSKNEYFFLKPRLCAALDVVSVRAKRACLVQKTSPSTWQFALLGVPTPQMS
jgi:hypothetical protein